MVTVLDSFEDGDISEYSGDTGSVSVGTTNVYDGSNALTCSADGVAITRTDVSIATGETPFGAWLWSEDDGGAGAQGASFYFAIQSATGYSNVSGYSITMESYDGTLEWGFNRFDSGSRTLLADSVIQDASVSKATYYQLAVTTWDSNGTIEFEFRDQSGTTLASGSITDTNYTSGGIGWGTYINSYGFEYWYDYAYKSGSPEAPTNLQLSLQ